MPTSAEFDEFYVKAVKNVADLDAVDGHKDRRLLTICAALEAGLRNPLTNAQYDALVMLREVAEHEIKFRTDRPGRGSDGN